jgi:site-specific DNA-methyltransferase (adenine-specific)
MTTELLNMDCMDYMRELPDNAFDLCIVDPPYGIGIDGQKACSKTNRIDHEFKGWDTAIPDSDYFIELRRVSKNQIVWGGNYMTDNLQQSPCWLIWDKMQEFSGATFEMAWTSFSSPAKAFRMSRVEAYTHQLKIHPTQKPVKLYNWILDNYAEKGQRILDTHLGSGSSAIAAHYFGCDFVGIELDEDYYKAACKRFDQMTRQEVLF